MELCDSGHKAIVHEGSECPLCDALEQIEALNEELSEAKEEIESLENDVAELERSAA